MNDASHGLRTRGLHAGHDPDETGARAPPIHQTTSYAFEDAADVCADFDRALREAN